MSKAKDGAKAEAFAQENAATERAVGEPLKEIRTYIRYNEEEVLEGRDACNLRESMESYKLDASEKD